MAAACAEYLAADQLIYLTDVPGVLDGEKVLSTITCEEIERLVQCRVVSGGMVLKLEAAKRAIEGGVREVRIVGGTAPMPFSSPRGPCGNLRPAMSAPAQSPARASCANLSLRRARGLSAA